MPQGLDDDDYDSPDDFDTPVKGPEAPEGVGERAPEEPQSHAERLDQQAEAEAAYRQRTAAAHQAGSMYVLAA